MSSRLMLPGIRYLPYLMLIVTVAACSAGSAQSDDGVDGGDTAASAANAPSSAGGARDACALITKAEVDSILKTSVTVTPSADDAAVSSCDYMPTGSGDGFSIKVHWTGGKDELALTKRVTRITPKIMRAGGINPAGMMALEPIDNLGDEAYFNPIYGSSVLKGDVLMEFDLRLMMFYTASQADATERWKALVRRALARL